MKKICTKCQENKNTTEFFKDASKIDQLSSSCKTCHKLLRSTDSHKSKRRIYQSSDSYKQYRKQYLEINSEYTKSKLSEYVQRPDIKEKRKLYYQSPEQKLKKKLYHENQMISNPSYKINYLLSHAIHKSLKTKNANISLHWEDLVGYSKQELKLHLETLFQKGMNWSNHGKWHIDHIQPLNTFQFDSHMSEEFRKAWSLSNLRPLWAKDNLSRPKDGSDVL